MSKFKLRGSRVLLTCPPRRDLGIHLSEEAQKEVLIQELNQMTSLEVFAIGDAVKDVEVGDKVYISPSTIMHAELVDVDKSQKFLIREMDIVLIW
jgi:hypothetical protein